jgi:hypothetical protein
LHYTLKIFRFIFIGIEAIKWGILGKRTHYITKANLHHWLKQRGLGGGKARPFFIAGFVPL